jgi:DNA-binding transcriptional MerR regulator
MKAQVLSASFDEDYGRRVMRESLTVGEVSRRAGVTAKTVRYYESIGLLPEVPRAANGYRRFRIEDVNRLKFIQRAKNLGLTLEEIRNLCSVAEQGQCDRIRSELKGVLDQKIEECTNRIAELISAREVLRSASQQLEASISHHNDGTQPHQHSAFAPECQCVPVRV